MDVGLRVLVGTGVRVGVRVGEGVTVAVGGGVKTSDKQNGSESLAPLGVCV